MLSKFLVILVSVLAVFVSSEARLYGRRSLRREPTKRSLFSKRQIKNRSNRRLVTFKSAKKQFAKRQKDWNDGYLWNFKADEMNDHQVGWGQPSHVGPQKMNGQGWYDEMNDHQVGWGDQPSHVGPQRPNGQGWYDEMNDHQVGWGQPSHVGPQKMNGQGWYDEMNDHQVGGWGWPDSFHK
jgi:hypothetical protein